MSYQADGSIVVLYPPKNVSNQWFSVRCFDAFAAAVRPCSHLNKNLKIFILFIYLFWFCHLFKPCYAYIVQIQHITVRVISLTQFHYEVNPISAKNGTWPADLRFTRPHVVRFIFETKIWILCKLTHGRKFGPPGFVNHLAFSKSIHEYGDQKHRGTGGRAVSGRRIGNRVGCQWCHVTPTAALMTVPFVS